MHRKVANLGAWPGLEHFTAEQYDEHLTAFLRNRPVGPVAVFAYGSRIWKRVFEPTAELRTRALGWHRAFSLRQKRFRGTPECPGLMMQIDRDGTCEGVLQLVPEDREWEVSSDVWRREMTARPAFARRGGRLPLGSLWPLGQRCGVSSPDRPLA